MSLILITSIQPAIQGEVTTTTMQYDLFCLLLAAVVSWTGVFLSVLSLRQINVNRHELRMYAYLLTGFFLLSISGITTSVLSIYSFTM